MVQGAVGTNDHALLRCQSLLQVQHTFIFHKVLAVKILKFKWSRAFILVYEVALKPRPRNEHLSNRLPKIS
jgi:hypothetical protein